MLKLVLTNLATHKIRTALTIAAIALSVSLVAATTGGYQSLESTVKRFLNRYMGAADAQITRKNDPHGGVKATLLEEVSRDPDVKLAVGRLELDVNLVNKNGRRIRGFPAQAVGIARPADTRVESMQMTGGRWFDGDEPDAAVIDQVAAESLKIDVGGEFELPGVEGKLPLKVVGTIRKPALLAVMPTIYVPIDTLRNFVMPDRPGEVSRVMIDLKPQVDAAAFAERWKNRLREIDPALRIRLAGDSSRQFDQNVEGMRLLSYLGGSVSMLAATFIIFSSLSMGVTERSRTLAMLRAVGAVKFQLVKIVATEGLLLAAAGVIVGVPLGWVWLWLLSMRFDGLFSEGVRLSVGGVLFAGVGTLAAALVASLLPAWSATRVSPLEAMSPLAKSSLRGAPLWAALGGLVLVCVDPLILFGPLDRWIDPATARSVQFYSHFVLGIPCVMLGFFLLAPLMVRVVERVIGPVIAVFFGLRFAMLRQQLSSGLWRAAGTCAALMVGLAILFALQTQGQSMINGWKLPDKFPDIFIASRGSALDAEQQRILAGVKGIRDGELLPIVVVSPGLGSGFFALAGSMLMPESTMFFGVDPRVAEKMLDLDFREGNARDAWAKIAQGRHVIVTEEFRQLKGLHVGSTLELETTMHGKVPYTVAGVVWSPGMDVFVSLYDTQRQLDERTAASVFGSIADAKNDFGVDRTNFFAANLEMGTDKDVLIRGMRRELRQMNIDAGDVRQIKAGIQSAFRQILLLASTVAFAAMAVASLGVTNTIMAGIRTRRWQFGVMRSIGVTRSQLLRLVLAEAVLLGIVGCAMGLLAGFEMSLNASRFAGIVVGYVPPMTIPWHLIGIGAGVVVVVSIVASLWPAVSVSRMEPLALLQAGRASA